MGKQQSKQAFTNQNTSSFFSRSKFIEDAEYATVEKDPLLRTMQSRKKVSSL